MPSEISFENFQYRDKDRYRLVRDGNSEVTFSYLINYAIVDMSKRSIIIEVDDHFTEMCEKIGDERDENGHIDHYLPLAGKIVENPIGEQLIAFCETDFVNDMKLHLALLKMGHAFDRETPEGEKLEDENAHEKTSHRVFKPTSEEELELFYYDNYEYLAGLAGNVLEDNLYVGIFPPLVRSRTYKMWVTYFNYILALQHEYRKLLDFCFNMDFYKEELEGITAASRYHLYCGTTDAVPNRTLTMSFRLTRDNFGNISVPVRDKGTYNEYMKDPAKAFINIGKERELNAFEREYGIDTIATDLVRAFPIPIASSFKCRSLEEILFLEFEKMLELDMQIKKCKNCGRYFILKGNYQTEYCDRIPVGETQTCQNKGATAKYAQKVKDNPALALFNRAYKRYHARLKVGSVKPDAFKKWKYEAVVMRDRCLEGEISAGEFEEWVNGYFK